MLPGFWRIACNTLGGLVEKPCAACRASEWGAVLKLKSLTMALHTVENT